MTHLLLELTCTKEMENRILIIILYRDSRQNDLDGQIIVLYVIPCMYNFFHIIISNWMSLCIELRIKGKIKKNIKYYTKIMY